MGDGVRFKNRYRVDSTRLRGWDYGSVGWYFVTVCTRDRRCWLGDVVDGRMRLSQTGATVAEEWRNTAKVRPNVVLDAWVVMPNHLHAILEITPDNTSSPTPPVETTRWVVSSPQRAPSPTRLHPNTLGSIIGQFKSVCTKRIRAHSPNDFAWQRGFYDRIIRSDKALDNTRRYIAANPSRWDTNKQNPPHPP